MKDYKMQGTFLGQNADGTFLRWNDNELYFGAKETLEEEIKPFEDIKIISVADAPSNIQTEYMILCEKYF